MYLCRQYQKNNKSHTQKDVLTSQLNSGFHAWGQIIILADFFPLTNNFKHIVIDIYHKI